MSPAGLLFIKNPDQLSKATMQSLCTTLQSLVVLVLNKFSIVENLITFDNNNALKIKVINVTLTANIANGDSISVEGIPSTAVFVSGFLYNYIKGEKMNIYEYWDLQVSQPNRCVIRKIKNYGFTSYATILAFYK